MQIEDQGTSQTETENSEATTQTSEENKSDTSTTKGSEEDKGINLGEGGDEGGDEPEKDTRTDEQKAADQAAEDERAKLFGAPEGDTAYEITGLPKGMEIDAAALEAVTPVFRELNLSNEGASKVAAIYAEKVLPGVSQQIVDGINADVVAKRKAWEGEARDAIAGKGEPLKTQSGEVINFGGHSLADVQKMAAKGLDKFAPAGFRKWLDETGLGVHPQMIALAYNIGKDVAEDRSIEASDTNTGKKSGGDGRPMSDPSKFYQH